MSHYVRIYETETQRIKIEHDDDPTSPKEWDQLGKLWIFHKRYQIGHKPDIRSEDFDGWDAIEEYLRTEEHAAIVLPIFLYDHSGITISTGSFSCPWDSGRVGFIWTTEEAITRNWTVKILTPEILVKAKEVLESEVKTWDQWLTGDIYGYTCYDLIRKDGQVFESDEGGDSCWGFYGSEEQDFAWMLESAVGAEEAKKAKLVKS